jgi:hypothetical protein
MTTVEQLLGILKARGLSLKLGDDDKPRLVGDKEQKTPAILDALKAFRPEILAKLKAERPKRREWKFFDGKTRLEAEGIDSPALNVHPLYAWYWRFAGDSDWNRIEAVDA